MRNESGPKLTGLEQLEGEHGNLPSLKMGRQVETISQQRLRHKAHLVLRDITGWRPCFNAIAIGRNPFRQMGKLATLLFARPEFIGELDVHREREIRPEVSGRAIVVP